MIQGQKNKGKKICLNANIGFSYFSSKQENLLAAIIFKNSFTVFYCDELIIEVKRFGIYKRIQKYNIEASVVANLIKMAAIHFFLSYPIKNYIPDDEDDNYIVALALQTNSAALLPVPAISYFKKIL